VYGVRQQQQQRQTWGQQRPGMGGGYQPRGMSAHYQGTVVIAGGSQSRNIVGTGASGQNHSNFSPQYRQLMTHQRQVIPQQQSRLSSSQAPTSNPLPPGVLSPSTPAPTLTAAPASKPAPPVNTFLSAFEKSFESFLNSKYNDEEEIATESVPKSDPSSVENISSILNDYSSSNSSIIRSNPLHLSKGISSPLTPASNHVKKVTKQQTIPKFNQSTKPKYNPVQEAKFPSVPRSLTLTTTTAAKHKPFKSNHSITSSSLQQSKSLTQQKSKAMNTSSGSPYRMTSVQPSSHQSPQALAMLTVNSNLSLTKVSSPVETIELEPETETVILDGPEEKSLSTNNQNQLQIKSDADRVFQCNSCPKTFKSSNHLRDHEITHTGNYPFKCETCKKGFIREKQLNNHKCSNREDKPKQFKCEECSKAYASRQSLREHKCAFAMEDKLSNKRGESIQEEEFLGEIIESAEFEVPVVSKCSEIIFSNINGVALISGDLIEYEDFECDLEQAVKDGWEVEVLGHDNMIWEDNCVEVNEYYMIPDGIEEIAKCAGLSIDEVKETLDFFVKSVDEKDKPDRFPWQEMQSEHEKSEQLKLEEKSKEKLLVDEVMTSGNSTLEELNTPSSKDVLEEPHVDLSKTSSVSKFTYFNDKMETTVGGGSGDDSDDDWTFGEENKCKVCKKKCSSKWHLKKHQQTHTAEIDKKGTYKCIPCKQSFKRKDLREKHRCDGPLSTSLFEDDGEMSSSNETLDEKVAIPITKTNNPKRQTLLLHSTLA